MSNLDKHVSVPVDVSTKLLDEWVGLSLHCLRNPDCSNTV